MTEIEFDLNIYDTIRKNIKKYRLEKNMTSSELADLVGLSHEFIRQIQSEKIAYNFSVDTFYRIAVVLGVSLDDLIQKTDLEITCSRIAILGMKCFLMQINYLQNKV